MVGGMKDQQSVLPECLLCGRTARPWLSVRRAPPAHEERSRKFHLFWCDACSYGFLSPTPSWDDLAPYYEEYHSKTGATSSLDSPPSPLERLVRHLAWRLDRGTRLTPELIGRFVEGRNVRILDVGCGNGRRTALMAEAGHTVCGLEPSDAARETARARGVQVYAGTAESLPPEVAEAEFDVVVMLHVLEHSLNPIAAIENMHRVLSPGGLLLAEVPNNEAVGLRISGERWLHMDIPRHFSYFTAKSLEAVVERAGFELVETLYCQYARQFNEGYLDEPVPGYLVRLLVASFAASKARKYDSVIVVGRKGNSR